MFLQRKLRTRFDLLKHDCKEHVLQKQAKQKEQYDRRANNRDFQVGQQVMIRNMRPGPKWIPGVIIERKGPLSYVVETEEKQVWHRHAEQLKVFGGEDVNRDSAQRDDSDVGLFARQMWMPSKLNRYECTKSRYPIRDRRPPVRLRDKLT